MKCEIDLDYLNYLLSGIQDCATSIESFYDALDENQQSGVKEKVSSIFSFMK